MPVLSKFLFALLTVSVFFYFEMFYDLREKVLGMIMVGENEEKLGEKEKREVGGKEEVGGEGGSGRGRRVQDERGRRK